MSASSHNTAPHIYPLNSFDDLCFGRTSAGPAYGEAVRKHSVELGEAYLQDFPHAVKNDTVIVSIPRGGVLTAQGLKEVFTQSAAPGASINLVASRIKTAGQPLLQDVKFDDTSTLVICDGVVGTGKTIVDHMKAIPASWQGVVHVFANAASAMGLQAIATHAAQMPQDVSITAGRVFADDECEWVNCGGKNVYFVGYNSAKGLDYKLPDFGDHISAPAP